MKLLRKFNNSKSAVSRQHLGILRNRKILLTGNFFPLDNASFVTKLNHYKGEVQTAFDAETEVLICGKFPDWNLIAEAEKKGAYVIFIDKVSDLFSLTQKGNEKYSWGN